MSCRLPCLFYSWSRFMFPFRHSFASLINKDQAFVRHLEMLYLADWVRDRFQKSPFSPVHTTTQYFRKSPFLEVSISKPVFERLRFRWKRRLSKTLNKRLRVDGRRKRTEKSPFSHEILHVWTGLNQLRNFPAKTYMSVEKRISLSQRREVIALFSGTLSYQSTCAMNWEQAEPYNK